MLLMLLLQLQCCQLSAATTTDKPEHPTTTPKEKTNWTNRQSNPTFNKETKPFWGKILNNIPTPS
jgi:hypothetical protein